MNASCLKIQLAPLRFLFAHFHYQFHYSTRTTYFCLFSRQSPLLSRPLALLKLSVNFFSFSALSPLLICCHGSADVARMRLGQPVHRWHLCAQIYSALHDNERSQNLIRSKYWAYFRMWRYKWVGLCGLFFYFFFFMFHAICRKKFIFFSALPGQKLFN